MGRTANGDSSVTRIFTLSPAYRHFVQPRASNFEPLFMSLYGPTGSATRNTTRIQAVSMNNAEIRTHERNRVAGALQFLTLHATERLYRDSLTNAGAPTSLFRGDAEVFKLATAVEVPTQATQGAGQLNAENSNPEERYEFTTDSMNTTAPYDANSQNAQDTSTTYYNPPVITNAFAQYQPMELEQVAAYANATAYFDGQQWQWGWGAPGYDQQEQAVEMAGPSNANFQPAPVATMPQGPSGSTAPPVRRGRARQARRQYVARNARRNHAVEIRAPPPPPPPAVLTDAQRASAAQHLPVVSYPQPNEDGATNEPSAFFTAPN